MWLGLLVVRSWEMVALEDESGSWTVFGVSWARFGSFEHGFCLFDLDMLVSVERESVVATWTFNRRV